MNRSTEVHALEAANDVRGLIDGSEQRNVALRDTQPRAATHMRAAENLGRFRVTDGDVGGDTDAEAEGDIRVMFSNSPRNLQDEVCAYLDDGVLDAADLDDLSYMLMPRDIEFSDASIPPDVIERTVTELCLARLD